MYFNFFSNFFYKKFGQKFQNLAQLINFTIGKKIQNSPNFFVKKKKQQQFFYKQQSITMDHMICKWLLVTNNSQGARATRLCPITNDLMPITKHNQHPLQLITGHELFSRWMWIKFHPYT
jgi:hypothetical protein